MLLKSNDGKIILGYDLGNTFSQISYCFTNDSFNVETLSMVAGEENFNIPTILGKRRGVSQWFFGNEALRFAKEENENCIIIDNLLDLAKKDELVMIEGIEYQPIALLTLFIKRSLGLLSMISSSQKIRSEERRVGTEC